MDILRGSGVLADIAAMTSPRNSGEELEAHLYKLNAYSTNGFFKPHRDTPKSKNHIGTIVVALPVAFEGGVLRVSHEDKDILFDWGLTATNSKPEEGISLPWAFLFSDVEHEVLPVTSGTRVTLAYDVFASERSHGPLPSALDRTTIPLFSDIATFLKNKDILPNGGKLAIAMSHTYPMDPVGVDPARMDLNCDDSDCDDPDRNSPDRNSPDIDASTGFASRLKGRDAILYRVFTSLGITVNVRVVYNPRVWRSEFDESNDDDDGFGPHIKGGNYYYILHTSKQFGYKDFPHLWDDDELELVQRVYGGRVGRDLIWVVKPAKESYSKMGNYVAYGNEASLEILYATAAFVLDIPAMGEGPRVLE